MSRADEIAQGLREPSGALIGGLDILEFAQGWEDFEAGNPPPRMTSTSYDLGRARAREKVELRTDVLREIEERQERSHQAVRDMLKDRPDLLADYDAKIACIRAGGNPAAKAQP